MSTKIVRPSGQVDPTQRIYLDVPFEMKDQVKALGDIHWDWGRKRWYTTAEHIHKFEEYNPAKQIIVVSPQVEEEESVWGKIGGFFGGYSTGSEEAGKSFGNFITTIFSSDKSNDTPGPSGSTSESVVDVKKQQTNTSVVHTPFPVGTEYVYVWLLEENKYYIGWSQQLPTRLEHHQSNKGALWTKKYKPISIVEIHQGGKELEKQKTIEYIQKYGFENVRGSYWCQVEYPTIPYRFQ